MKIAWMQISIENLSNRRSLLRIRKLILSRNISVTKKTIGSKSKKRDCMLTRIRIKMITWSKIQKIILKLSSWFQNQIFLLINKWIYWHNKMKSKVIPWCAKTKIKRKIILFRRRKSLILYKLAIKICNHCHRNKSTRSKMHISKFSHKYWINLRLKLFKRAFQLNNIKIRLIAFNCRKSFNMK